MSLKEEPLPSPLTILETLAIGLEQREGIEGHGMFRLAVLEHCLAEV